MDHASRPVTRRHLRLRAESPRPLTRRDIHRRVPNRSRHIGGLVRAFAPSRGPTGRHAVAARARHRRESVVGVGPALGLALAVLVTVTGVGLVHADLNTRTADAAAQATVQAAEQRERADSAQTNRLTAEAAAFAERRRVEALVIALEVLESADTAVLLATDVVGAEVISPLDEAVAELTALIAASPVSIPVPIRTDDVEQVDHPGSGNAVVAEPDGTATRPAPPGSTPAPESTLPDGPYSDLVPRGGTSSTDRLRDLDLAVTTQMLEMAERIALLAEEVQATAEAEIEAARVTAAELEAARAAAADLARRVAAADAAPNGAIPRDLLCGVDFSPDVLLRCDAAAALEDLNVAYRAHFGRDLRVVSSYRDLTTQHATKETRGDLAATPGTSQHGRGVAVDLAGFGTLGDFTQPTYLWMKANSSRYGWGHPAFMGPTGAGPHEPWHWEYHG